MAAALLCALVLTAPLAFAQDKPGAAGGAGAAAAGQAAQGSVSESDLLIGEGTRPAAGAQNGGVAVAPTVSTWDFVRMLLVLAAVVGFIYLIFHFLKKSSGRNIRENDLIKVLGSRSLSGNRSLHLVETGGCLFLVGSSDGGVTLISEIKDKEGVDSIRLKAAETSAEGRRSFQEVLADIFKPAGKRFSLGDGVEALKEQRERLRKLRDRE
jgi:flagellar protein FliO/FliZ